MLKNLAVVGAVALSTNHASAVVSNSLAHLKVKVNGKQQIVKNGEEFSVVLGDRLVLEEAVLAGKGRVANVNFVGFQSPKALRPAEDRGFEIHTERDLLKYWSVDRKGVRYRIKAFTGRAQLGQVFVRLLTPKLTYAKLTINGQPKIVRPGEILSVKADDEFEVKEIVTNIDNDGEEVEFDIKPLGTGPEKLARLKFYELRFFRKSQQFAEISLQIADQ